TIGDEMIVASGGRAKVFSVSIKDRAAILSGGHRGKTFWYDKDTGTFTTSTYYYSSLPGWATQWNEAKHADTYAGTAWTLMHAPETYLFAKQDDRVFERPYKAMGRAFPHPLGESAKKEFFGALRYAPMGDALTVDFAKTLIDAEQLGADDTTDLLAISLSVTDYIGHAYGPDSLEAEDNLLQLDRTVAALLKHVDEKIGLDSTVIILSSDHGVDLIPEARCADAIEGQVHAATTQSTASVEAGCDAGRHYPEKFVERINDGVMKRLGVMKPLVTTFWDPSLYLDMKAVSELKLDAEAVERAVADEVVKLPGFNRAFTRTDLLAGRMPKDAVARAVAEAFHPQRSGHVMIVPSPFWYLYDNPEEFAAMHGTPYSYDTFVPVLIATPGGKSAKVHRRISPRSVAPTLAAIMGIVPPSGSTGEVLVEVFGETHSTGVAASAAMSAASK
nr:alkaline phosphatase family protein [Chthoniobacterales bacterium]